MFKKNLKPEARSTETTSDFTNYFISFVQDVNSVVKLGGVVHGWSKYLQTQLPTGPGAE